MVAAGALTFGPTVALIVVDVQNDFADSEGSLYVAGGEEIIPVINALAADAVAAGSPVVLTQDWHPEETPHFIDDGGVWPRHCVRDTWGARLHADLIVSGPIVRKGVDGEDGYSGFTVKDPLSEATTATELDRLLRNAGVTSTVVVGIALDVCVKATAEDAKANGYSVTVIRDATRAVDLEPGDGERAVEALIAGGIAVI